ncbi:MAG: peptide ABC transporter substrate-binding protein [Gammaproteobacteria bacterium]|nr:peptide ABC transporter substrate-binding protein [Gammaproteobacteria bacterium]
MTQEIAESDWKHFCQLHSVALERFCQIILSEVASVNADGSKSFHQRYLDIYKIIERRDKELSKTFNDLRRSTALMQLVSIYGLGLLTEVELSGFSQEVVSVVKSFNKGRHA